MATSVEGRQVVHPEDIPPLVSGHSSLSEDGGARTIAGGTRDADDETASTLSMVSYPDYAGRKGFTSPDDEPAKAVYEAWEIIAAEDTSDWSTWKSFCGINFGIKWRVLDDGFLDLNPLTGYSQGELADLHVNAVQEYEGKCSKKKGISYAQDLANRVFNLDSEIYNKIQLLIDDKTSVTNKTPFRRREWRVVILEEGEYQITELLPERKKRFFQRQREQPAIEGFFIVLRGEEVKKVTEDGGWRLFNRRSNPWWRIDAQETREARKEHKEHFEKANRKREARRSLVRNFLNMSMS